MNNHINYKPISSRCRAKGLIFLPVISAQLIFLAGLWRFCNNATADGMSAAVVGKRGLVILSMIELSFYLLAIPIIFCLLLPAESKTERTGGHGTKWGRMLFTIIFTALLILPSFIPAVYLYNWQLPANVIFTYLTTLFFIALFFTAIAHLMNTITTNAFASIVTVYLILLSMIFSVILVNPIIKWVTDPHIIIQSALILNPYIAISSSINLDILRTDPLYYLSTISAYQFRYPAPFQFWLFYGFMALCLFVIEMVFFKKTK
ncbi:MAG: hypothetical protein HY807_12125 [Nitrospirae bacterium]|nr:hypothetical protein [Nitrospirota bacterium]